MAGWIKLHRKILEWEWYDDINTMRLWLHILLKVNREDKTWHGIYVPAGTMITSYAHLSEETGLTVDEIRTCMSRLLACQNITRTPHKTVGKQDRRSRKEMKF